MGTVPETLLRERKVLPSLLLSVTLRERLSGFVALSPAFSHIFAPSDYKISSTLDAHNNIVVMEISTELVRN